MTDDVYDAVYALLRAGLNTIHYNRRIHTPVWKELKKHIESKFDKPGVCPCGHDCHGFAGMGGRVDGWCRGEDCECKNCKCSHCELKFGKGSSYLTTPINIKSGYGIKYGQL